MLNKAISLSQTLLMGKEQLRTCNRRWVCKGEERDHDPILNSCKSWLLMM